MFLNRRSVIGEMLNVERCTNARGPPPMRNGVIGRESGVGIGGMLVINGVFFEYMALVISVKVAQLSTRATVSAKTVQFPRITRYIHRCQNMGTK